MHWVGEELLQGGEKGGKLVLWQLYEMQLKPGDKRYQGRCIV